MISLIHLPTTLLTYSFSIVVFLIGIFLLRFVALPLRKVCSYKQDGVSTYFFPILGFFRYNREAQEKMGDIMGRLKETTKHVTNPKYMVTHMGRTPFYVLQGPQYIKEFLQKQNQYRKGDIYDVGKVLAGNGLVGAEGETWKRHRKIISSSFNFEFLKTSDEKS